MQQIDQVVIVTGASQGIGKQVAMSYAQNGAKVVLADIQQEAGEKLSAEIRRNGGEALFVTCDTSKEADIQQVLKQTLSQYKRVDVLINNAGLSFWKNVYELSVEDWDRVLNVNLRGTFLFAREAAKEMRNNEQGGAIVNIASTRALMSEKNSEAYAASKGGIVALTHALAVSLGEDRIRVNAISPGWIQTTDYEQLKELDHTQHPAQRVGKPEDIAKACLYLTDPQNDFITGINLVIDGGMTRKMIYEE